MNNIHKHGSYGILRDGKILTEAEKKAITCQVWLYNSSVCSVPATAETDIDIDEILTVERGRTARIMLISRPS